MQYEYDLIKVHYGTDTAARSGVPLINHIDEGLVILDKLGAADETKAAFCLHPLVQSNAMYHANIKDLVGDSRVGNMALVLAVEYRRAANAYLCTPSTDGWGLKEIREAVKHPAGEVLQMLVADKQQNFKDFMEHHFKTHPRSQQLYAYFHNWFKFLEILP